MSRSAPDASVPADSTSDARFSRTLARHPRPLGGDPMRSIDAPAISLTGMVMNNRDAATQQIRIGKKPDWLRARAPGGEAFLRTKALIESNRLHTVCQEASCPNIGECWARGAATIMILGDTCTRACGFCNVKTGRPPELDLDEPRRVAEVLSQVRLKHVVITSVNRDELPDGGAAIWAETIERVRAACPEMSLECLVGDFAGDPDALQTVIDARPTILAHNLETVERMHPAVRPQARYERSLEVLRRIRAGGLITKTGIMVGIGERPDEILRLLDDVQEWSSAEIITIGQYLQPTRNHLPIDRWVHPDEFEMLKREGLARGFRVVESGPLVRSSYHADEQADLHRRLTEPA